MTPLPSVAAFRRPLAALVLAALAIAYCLPGHPHARSGSVMDVAAHAAAFFLVSLALARASARGIPALAAMALLAVGLEALQQLLGGYRAVEWSDIGANLAGVLLAAVALRRMRPPATDIDRVG